MSNDKQQVVNVDPYHIEFVFRDFQFHVSVYGNRGNGRIRVNFTFSLWWIKHFRSGLKKMIAEARKAVDSADVDPEIQP